MMHLLYQLTQTYHPQPHQNSKIQLPIHSQTLTIYFQLHPQLPQLYLQTKFAHESRKLFTDIQRNAKLSIIKIVGQYSKKQNKHENKNKNFLYYKPRFKPTEHPTTSPIYTFLPINTTKTTQNMKQELKKHIPATATHYTQPAFKTTATQYT